jgi:hypothetical protein
VIHWGRGDLVVCCVTVHRQLQPIPDLPLVQVDQAMIPMMPLTQLMRLNQGEEEGREEGEVEEGKKRNQTVLFSNNIVVLTMLLRVLKLANFSLSFIYYYTIFPVAAYTAIVI